MGSSASMDWWEDDFCRRLADQRFVIRYDHRDTGRSVTYEPGAPPYTGADLAADALGVLDALGVQRAHLVGMSMGGALAQVAAIGHPDRVASLTLISTSPAVAGPEPRDLPPMSSQSAARFAVDQPEWSDREAVIDYLVHLARASAGDPARFDEAEFRAFAGRVVDRSNNIESAMRNHDRIDGGEPSTGTLGDLSVPVLVVHGACDPVFPLEHARALVGEIPGARLLTLEGTGHELPRPDWDTVVPAIVEHTSQGQR
jgi:pimeloyl-ACP methyl ester carboxylesterase